MGPRRTKKSKEGLKKVAPISMTDFGIFCFRDEIDTILRELPDQRQSLLFSATMPVEIEDIARALPWIVRTEKLAVDPAILTQA